MKKKKKILYLHGLGEEIKFPGGGEVFKTLGKLFNIEFLDYSSDPVQGWKDFGEINFKDYSLVVGFSLGGVYACCQSEIPIILVNPGFGVSKKYGEGFKKIDDLSLRINKNLVQRIIVGENDKYKEYYLSEIEKRDLMDKVVYLPFSHIPERSEIMKYIIPEIKKYI